MIGKLGFKAAVTVKDTVAKKIEEERKRKVERKPNSTSNNSKSINDVIPGRKVEDSRPEHYISDDEHDATSFV
jgi:hypothetical protein